LGGITNKILVNDIIFRQIDQAEKKLIWYNFE
jgi:hypothetical protein